MIRIALPYPPSGWELYTGWAEKRRLSPQYKKWRNDAGYYIKAPKLPIAVPFSISIALRRQNVRQDIDNRSKAILDCLQHYGVIKNDNLCERLSMHWDADLPAECIVILQVAEEAIAA
ncbi:RusA family crossover junction endodeoxyribonuclease [Shinella sp.]|uniref:RusA family crossover junction endodeoxyribonuclease n=1 Tax=Shinella sp. TaxID=1870904 RepID=UPI0029B308BB|nr:RusA family crossover junction endodeoxyribonuclease [Shinella sp.]MDX3973270.1 RusA family crossover junction endodeoxyribonuclease [Shinella sp.]